MSILDHEDLNTIIIEHLKSQGYHKTADSIQHEIKSISHHYLDKFVNKKTKIYTKGLDIPRLMALKKTNFTVSKREVNL